MKILGFEIRKFDEEPTKFKAVETWLVIWYSVRQDISCMGTRFRPTEEKNMLSFTSKEDAIAFAKELADARKLLGDIYEAPTITTQKIPTNN